MKRILRALSILLSLVVGLGAIALPARADADLAIGAKVFSANCAACHAGGINLVNAEKTLKKEALEKYDMNSIAAITTQVTNGKAAMPAFKGRLTDEQIAAVAAYVIDQAEKGW
ncbi:MAG: c-type cytochrome [Cyanobacteria bacterium J069]|nr:MAG: cytochrome C6 [Cyanobacteria bacterium J069]